MYYIKYFFLTSVLGFLLENIFCKNYDSGILYGPWTPVYGIGSIIIILVSEKIFKKYNLNRFTKYIIIFISSTLLLSLSELVGGLLIEKIFGYSFWDYSNHKFHIGKYVCLEMSIVWGIASILFIVILKKPLDKIVNKIPNYIIYATSILFVIDIIYKLLNK